MEPVFTELASFGVVPVVTVNNAADAVPLARALAEGGLPVAEVTFRTDAAAEAIRRIVDEVPGVLAGAGTVLTPAQADAAVEAGAAFLVAPGFNPDMVDYAKSLGVPFMPGLNTPSHIELAVAKGLSMAKYFPAAASGGPGYLETINGPYRHCGLRFMATGGVNLENCADYLRSDVIAACGGTWIAPSSLIDAGRFDVIAENARQALAAATGMSA